jgi:hypothetical protein
MALHVVGVFGKWGLSEAGRLVHLEPNLPTILCEWSATCRLYTVGDPTFGQEAFAPPYASCK